MTRSRRNGLRSEYIGALLIGAFPAGCGESVTEPEPLGVAGEHNWVSVAAGDDHTCGLTTDQRAFCWGEGAGSPGDDRASGLVEVPGDFRWQAITVGDDHGCGLTTAGDAWCWGDDDDRDDDDRSRWTRSPWRVPGGHTWASISAGDDVICGVTTGDDAYCWRGDDDDYDDDDYGWGRTPTPPASPAPLGWLSVSAGDDHACGISVGREAFCWGVDDDDDYDDDDQGRRSRAPFRVGGHRDWSMISVGDEYLCGISTGGDGHCWRGDDDDDDDDDDYRRWGTDPQPIDGGHSWAMVSAGDEHVCGVTTESEAWCWGEGDHGQLGDGRSRSSSQLVKVAGDLRWTMVSAGDEHTCGVTADHEAYCWGESDDGQLGTASSDRSLHPVSVGPGSRG